MTIQASDRFIYKRKSWGLFGIHGDGLFNPNDFNVKPLPASTALYRGYVCCYEVIQEGLYLKNLFMNLRGKGPPINNIEPKRPETPGRCNNLYENINLKISFTGALLIGTYSEEEPPVHLSVHIYELIFENGNILEVRSLHEKIEKYPQNINSLDFNQKTNLIRSWFKRNYDPPIYSFYDSYSLVGKLLDGYLSKKEHDRLYNQIVEYCNKHSIEIPSGLHGPYGPWIIIRTNFNPHRLSAVTGNSKDDIERYIKGYSRAHDINLPLEQGKRFPLKIVYLGSEKETSFYVNSEGDMAEEI